MKRVAIVTMGVVPVPAIKGGAVETLTTYFLTENEKQKRLSIDLYTIEDAGLQDIELKNTNIIEVKEPKLKKMFKLCCSVCNRLFRLLKIQYEMYYMDFWIVKRILQEKQEYDYILFENNMNTFELFCRKNKRKIKLIFHLHNDIGRGQSKSLRQCRFVEGHADKILTASGYLMERFRLSIQSKKTFLLQNCVDFDLFAPEKYADIPLLREKYNLGKEDFLFLYSGRICEEKGIFDLLLAMEKIPKNIPVKLLLIGDTWFKTRNRKKYFEKINKIIEGNKERIMFSGYIDYKEIPEYYTLSDVVIVPSKCQEAFGMVALEAMAMRKPLIVTKVGGLKDIVDEKCAITLEPDDKIVEKLKDAMLEMYFDKERVVRMGDAAYERSHSHFFGTDVYFEKLLEYMN